LRAPRVEDVKTGLPIPKEHPAYDGHFPGHPMLPGVVLLAEAMAALDKREWNVDNAKFLQPVAPGTALTLSHEETAAGLRFEIESAGGVVATAQLSRP
jgi:3-hydroxymyristoyl/3-hydroxydecanoyl-(acyl carrier protein) dehydratase